MKLTKREKTLLCVLAALALLAALGMFWIAPHYQALSINKETLAKLEDRRAETEALILRSQAAEQEIARLQTEADSLFRLMEQTKSYDVSLLLSELLARYELVPVSLKISNYQTVETPDMPVEEETESKKSAYEQLDEQLDQYDGGGEAASPESGESFALKRTATLSFTGERENANRFLDEITDYNRSVLVDGYTIERSSGTEVYDIRIDFYEFVKPTLQEAGAQTGEGEG